MSQRAAKTVERLRERDIREREPRTLVPHRQFNRPPAPVGQASPETMTLIADAVAKRIRTNRRAVNCGSYVLASEEGKVFVLKEQAVTTPALIAAHAPWLVGLYAANTRDNRRVKCPSADQVLDDLRAHFADIGQAVPA